MHKKTDIKRVEAVVSCSSLSPLHFKDRPKRNTMSTNSFIINGKTPINGEWVGADSGVTFPVYSESLQRFALQGAYR